MEKNQDIVLRVVYWKGKEITVDEIMRETSFKRKQVHIALDRLKQRGFITKRTEQPGVTNGKWHSRKSFINIQSKKIEFVEGYLIKRGLIQNVND